MSKVEIQERFKEASQRVEIINHNSSDTSALLKLDEPQTDFPIIINKEVYESDIKIGIGNITPHLMAGWTGGGKIIAPGISGVQTIGGIHLLGGKHRPALDLIGTHTNEVRKVINKITVKVGLHQIINTVLNKRKDVADIVVGHPQEAFHRGVTIAEKIYKQPIKQYADIVIASSYPADIDYWQAIKSVVSASLAVKPGGIIFLITPCTEGVSPTHNEMREYGHLNYDEIMNLILNKQIHDPIAAGTLLFHAQLIDRSKIIVYSEGLREKDVEALGMIYVSNINEGLELAFERSLKNPKIGLIHNSEVLPTLPH